MGGLRRIWRASLAARQYWSEVDSLEQTDGVAGRILEERERRLLADRGRRNERRAAEADDRLQFLVQVVDPNVDGDVSPSSWTPRPLQFSQTAEGPHQGRWS